MHRMIADHVAHTQRVHADFALGARTGLTLTAMTQIAAGAMRRSTDGVGNTERSARRRVDFLIVMGFDDFDVVFQAQRAGDLRCHAEDHVDTHAHVWRVQYWRRFHH